MSYSPNAKHHENHGSVFCPHASLWFPTVYQLTWPHLQGQNATTWPHFTIDKSGYDETARLSQIASPPANAPMSILIKHHRTKEEAVAFLSAISIFDPSQHCSGFTETRTASSLSRQFLHIIRGLARCSSSKQHLLRRHSEPTTASGLTL